MKRCVRKNFHADAALFVWALQHVFDPQKVLSLLDKCLMPGGKTYILNNHIRCVPCDVGYIDDGISVKELANSFFELVAESELPEAITTKSLASHTAVSIYIKQ